MKSFVVVLALISLVGAHPHKRQVSSVGVYSGQNANVAAQQLVQKLPFLQGVNRQGQEEFFSLITNMNTPRNQIEASLDSWAQKYNVQSQWTTFKTQYEAQKTELIAALRDFVGKLPAAFDQIIQNGENKSISGQEALNKDASLFSSLTENVGNAIQKFASFLFGDKNSTSTGGNPWGGNNNGGTPGNGVFPGGNNNNGGNNNGGFPGNNNGGFPGNNNGGFPGNNNGGFPGNNNGGFPGNNNGGFPGNQNGGFPGNNNGGFPGNNNGGFPGNTNGGSSGNQNGGFPGSNNGGSNGGFPGNNNGQFGANGGFPGQFGGNNNNNNQFGGFQIPGQQGTNFGQNNNGRSMGGGAGQFTQNGFSRF